MKLSIIILLLLFATATGVSRVRQDYQGPHEGTFVYPLPNNFQVDSITWCSELFVPREKKNRRDIGDCQGANLIHYQVYPGNARNYDVSLTQARIHTEHIGGFWLPNRQANVIIRGRYRNAITKKIIHIVRINQIKLPPLPHPSGLKEEGDKHVIPPPISASVHDGPPQSSSRRISHSGAVLTVTIFGALILLFVCGGLWYARRKHLWPGKREKFKAEEKDYTAENNHILLSMGKGTNPIMFS